MKASPILITKIHPLDHMPEHEKAVVRRFLFDCLRGLDEKHHRRWMRLWGRFWKAEPGEVFQLLNVIERMLTPEGQLWLAEPVRKTAQRFLDSAAEHGWEVESRQVKAHWPDATDGPVNLHFLRRSREPDRIAGDLGGWRI